MSDLTRILKAKNITSAMYKKYHVQVTHDKQASNWG